MAIYPPNEDLRSIDLNLLVILDTLLDEAHVSRAAVRLHLSQPATSSALERLHHLFGDRLLERGRGGMRLTPAAEALRLPLRDALGSIAALMHRGKNDPGVPWAFAESGRLHLALKSGSFGAPDLFEKASQCLP